MRLKICRNHVYHQDTILDKKLILTYLQIKIVLQICKLMVHQVVPEATTYMMIFLQSYKILKLTDNLWG